MELSIMERVMLLNILPTKGNIVTLKLVQELRDALSFDEDDIEKAELTQDDETGRVTWETNIVKTFDFGKKVTGIIVKTLEQLNLEEALTSQHMSLCEKFLED